MAAPRLDHHTIVCGAGIAGVATAHYLAESGITDVLIVDRDQPLSLTTAKSGENYRDYWPHHAMTGLSTASVELMRDLEREHGDVFAMYETGYLFASRERGHDIFPPATAKGGSEARLERYIDPAEIRRRWPHLNSDIEQVVIVPRAGSIDVQALGNLLLGKARRLGVQLRRGLIQSLRRNDADAFVIVIDGQPVVAATIVLATGPFVGPMAAQLGLDLPLINVAQRKFVVPDPGGVIPRDMPFTICADPLTFSFDDADRQALRGDPELSYLLEPFPAGLHIKPEPGGLMKLGWAFNQTAADEPRWSIEADPAFPNVVMRGAAQMIPELERYIDSLPTPVVQYGGYYNRTAENWPLIGPTDEPGVYVAAGLAGFGTMCGCAVGDLVARHMTGAELPGYANYMNPNRYDNPDIAAELAATASDGQL